MERINAAQRRTNNQMAGQQPRVNAAERRINNQGGNVMNQTLPNQPQRPGSGQAQQFNGQMQPRVNAAERRLINQGAMPDPRQAAPQTQPMQPQQKPPMQSNPFGALPTQKLPQTLPNGQARQPGDPNIYGMDDKGNMMGTLIGWNQNNDPNWGSQWKGALQGIMQNPRLQPFGGSRTSTLSPGIGLDGQRIRY